MCEHGLWLIPEWNHHHWNINQDSKTCALSKYQAPLKLTIRQNQRSDLTSFDTHPPFGQSRKLKKVSKLSDVRGSGIIDWPSGGFFIDVKALGFVWANLASLVWWFGLHVFGTCSAVNLPKIYYFLGSFYARFCNHTKNVTLELILWLLFILLCLFYSRCPPTFFVFS